MRRVIYFATHNKNKFKMAREIVDELGIPLVIRHLDVEYPEDKDKESFSYVAKKGAEFCANQYHKRVFVTDVGIEIAVLNGFPGINTAFTLKRIGVEGMVRLMKGIRKRRITACLALAYCGPRGKPFVWQGRTRGKMPFEARGKQGFGWDSIFIPQGFKQTFAEDPKLRNDLFSFRKGILAMFEYFQRN